MTDTTKTGDPLGLLGGLIEQALKVGADAADAVFVEGTSLSVAHRLGKPERLERSEGANVGLRVFVGRRQAIVSSSDTGTAALGDLVDRVLAMARSVPEDEYCGLAEPEVLAEDVPDLDLDDADEHSQETLAGWAAAAEDAARAVSGVTNSEGAEAGWGRDARALAASNGFAHAYRRSRCSVMASVLAGEGTAMERDYDYATAVHAEDLRDPEEIGRAAGERAVARLNARKAASAQVPVVYDPRVSGSLLGHLAGAIGGAAVARGTTFLKDKLGERIFPQSVTIVDDPRRRRGLRSRPFDGEGIGTRPIDVVKDGVLSTWILDLRSARQLGMSSTGHASRGASSAPSPSTSNLYLKAGSVSPATLMADIKGGFLVTELIGMSLNSFTGDYSRGAVGFWIEDGVIAYPVSEVTIAGNVIDMFAQLSAADDLEFRYGVDAPTLRVDGMTVAGR